MIASLLIVIGVLSVAFLSRPATGFAVIGVRRSGALLADRTIKVMPPPSTVVNDGPKRSVMLRMCSGITQAADSVVEVLSRRELRKIVREAEVRIIEETRIKEEAERIRHESELRTVEQDALKDLDECMKECRAVATKYAWNYRNYTFEIRNLRWCEDKRLESLVKRLREVLDRELPLRFPGVDFKLEPLCNNCGFDVELDWSGRKGDDKDEVEGVREIVTSI